jgi:hypothetical protein
MMPIPQEETIDVTRRSSFKTLISLLGRRWHAENLRIDVQSVNG